MWKGAVLKIAIFAEKLPLPRRIITNIMNGLATFQREIEEARSLIAPIAPLVFLGVMGNALALYTLSSFIWQNPPTYLDFLLMAALASTLSFLPITIAGLGIEEGCYLLILTSLGMPFEKAVALVILARILFTGTDAIGLPVLLKFKHKRNVFRR
jgi:uncharacterized membrane protein YbhN (UPF0104 family)